MNWKAVAQLAGKFAPLLGRVLGGPAGHVAGEILAGVLGVESDPESVLKALEVKADAEQVLRALELKHQGRLSEILLLQEQAVLAAAVQTTQTVNETMRAEIESEHWFYRSWRPAYGWLIGVCFFSVIMNSIALAWFKPESLPIFISFITSTVILWTMAFGVLGVYVHKRSVDKQLKAGVPTPSPASMREQMENLF